MPPLVALGVNAAPVNALGAFQDGQKAAAGVEAAKLQQAAKTMEMIGSGAMYALNGDINGQVDPAKYKEVLDSFQGMGVDVTAFRNNPNFAKVAAQASVSAMDRLRLANSDRDYELALEKFEFDIQKAGQQANKPQSTLGKLAADFEAGLIDQPTFEAARSKATQNSNGITVNPDGTVQIGGPAQGTFDKETSKKDVELIKEAREAANVAQGLGAIATQMEQVIGNVGYTGLGGGLYGAVDDTIGVLPGDKGSRGAFKNMSMEAQLAMTEKTKGAITDREMDMFRQAVPGLTQTEEGNKSIIQIMRATAKRQQDRASFFEAYRARTGTLNGATEAWGQYIEENPLIAENPGGGVRMIEPKKDIDQYIPQAPAQASVAQTAQPGATATQAQGTSKVIGDKTYVQDENGDWYEAE